MKFVVQSLCCILAVVACSHLPKKQRIPLEASQFWEDQRTREVELRQISAKLMLHYRGREESGGGRGRLVVQSPNFMRLELRDLLGRMQYLLTLSDARLTAYYPGQHIAYIDDDQGRRYLDRWIETELSLSEFESVILGILPRSLAKPGFDRWAWNEERGLYQGDIRTGNRSIRCFVDSEMKSLREVQLDSKLKPVHITFDDFQRGFAGHSFFLAETVRISRDNPSSEIEVQWEGVSRWEGSWDRSLFNYALPEDVKKIWLK